MENLKVVLADKIEMVKCNGICSYSTENVRPSVILIDSKSKDTSKVLIHECIHKAIFNVSEKQQMVKLSHKLNKREDFIEELSEELSEVFKFIIKDKYKNWKPSAKQ